MNTSFYQNPTASEASLTIEQTIELYENSEELTSAKALATLQSLPEWDTVFTDGLFKTTVVRLALLRKSPELILNPDPLSVAQLNSVDELLDSIGVINSHFNSIISKGREIEDYLVNLKK